MQSNNLSDLKDQVSHNIMLMEKDFDNKMQDTRDKIMEIHVQLGKKADDAGIRKWVTDLLIQKTGELSEYLTNRIDRLNMKVDRNHDDVLKQMNQKMDKMQDK